MRKTISVKTLEKIERFMQEQEAPVRFTFIRDSTNVDFESLRLGLELLKGKGLVVESDGLFVLVKK